GVRHPGLRRAVRSRRGRWRPVLRRPDGQHGRGRGGLRRPRPLFLSAAPAGIPRPAANRPLQADPLPRPLHERRPRSVRTHRPAEEVGQGRPQRQARDLPGARAWPARCAGPGSGRRLRLREVTAVTASTHMVKANGLRFRTLVEGPPDGDMVLLAHAGFLAVAPDLRGYGLTDAPEGVENYSMEHLVADAKGLIEAFGRTSAHIAGHDWGAVVAWYFAGAYPDMTATLTALSVGHPAALAAASREDPDQQTRQTYIGLFVQAGKAERVLTDQDSQRLRAMYRVGPNPDAMPERVVEGFVRSMTRPGRLTAGLNYYRANLKTGGA